MQFQPPNKHASGQGAAGVVAAGQAPMNQPLDDHASPPSALTCFLVEDSPVIRQNLVATLEEMLAIQIVGTAEDERTAVDWMRTPRAACDLMVIDIFLKSGTGLEVLRQATHLLPGSKRVVLTNYATAEMRRRCVQLGADRVFDKSAELEELLAYVEDVASQRGR